MDDSASIVKSPSSVASDHLANRIPSAAVEKMIEAGVCPPVHRAQPDRGNPFNRSASLPEDSKKDAADPAMSETKDDIEAHRPPSRARLMASFRGNLSISDSTREILERMSENQVQDATKALEEVKQRRKKSGLEVIGSINQKKRLIKVPLADFKEDETISNSEDSSDDNEEVAEGIKRGAEVTRIPGVKNLTQSLGVIGKDQFGSDGEEGEEDIDDRSFESGEKRLQQMLNMCSHDEAQLQEVDAIADETLDRIVGRNTGSHSMEGVVIPKPKSQRRKTRRDGRERRAGLMTQSWNGSRQQQSSAWKPLSSNQRDSNRVESEYDTDEEEERAAAAKKKEAGQQHGIGGLWNKLTSSFTADGPLNKEAIQEILGPDTKPKSTSATKEISGAAYFRRGKKKANKCKFLQAVACFNFALVRQRDELGKNHIDCATTLNEIGVCWMMLGERYPALTAFEEALFIRQKKHGDGAMEVAEVTNNIWMILHEERKEMESMMMEGDEEDENES